MWDLGNKMQLCIQGYNKRPYGVGLLVAGHDDLGPHIYQVFLKTKNSCPTFAGHSGNEKYDHLQSCIKTVVFAFRLFLGLPVS